MMLIADSGSTKTEWCLVDQDLIVKSFVTAGINPFFQDSDQIAGSIKTNLISFNDLRLNTIYFYGAGCANQKKIGIVTDALNHVFRADNVEAASDLLGAARSMCQHQQGIACILGTGSNSCYYDGKEIVANVSPLGFILGDDGSGAAIGKKLITDILRGRLPKGLIQDFFDTFQITKDDILDAIYKSPFPNRYLAQFTHFLLKHIAVPEVEELVMTSFSEFVSKHILQYSQAFKVNIHFVGSVAWHFSPQLVKALHLFNLREGKICKNPIEGLIAFHKGTC
jgi:glucosamine kinase